MPYQRKASNPSPSPHRVVVVGVGIVTALGCTYRDNAEGFRTGRTAFRPVTLFPADRQRVQCAAEIDLPGDDPETRLTPKERRRLDRASRMLLLAASEAWQQSQWTPESRLPVVMGTTSGGMPQGQAYYETATRHPHLRTGQANRVLQYQVTAQTGLLGQAFGFDGVCVGIANACASGSNAVGRAWQLIHHGHASQVLTGGYDALSHLVFAGFDALQALSPTTCRPFDVNRDGLALGEGAAVLALERLDLALARQAPILGEIVGYAAASDTHHITQPHPAGRAALTTMQQACRIAGIEPSQVDYVNAHGTGTPLNDAAEAAALAAWAGCHAPHLQVSSTKGSVGHLLGAAGAVEAVICLMALHEGWLPPNVPLSQPDPACTFQVLQHPSAHQARYALSNSFGFGGANASLLFKHWTQP